MDYKFKGVCPVVNLPFYEDEKINYDDLANETEFLLKQGCTSLCLFAFNTEPHKLTNSEKEETIEKFLHMVNGRAETIVGIVENSIKGGQRLAGIAEKNGADGIILYPPSLSTPQGDNLLGYFKAVAGSVDCQVMLQDNPRSTGVSMTLDTILRTFEEIENFNYLKVECPIPVRKLRKIVEVTDGKLKCYSGNGGIHAVSAKENGAWGIMPGAVVAKQFIDMYNLIDNGRLDEARAMFEYILPLVWFEDQSLEFYIACEKELLKHMGVFKDNFCRKPHEVLAPHEIKELYDLYGRLR